MPSRYYQRNFTPNYYYHIYNRGSRKQNIFSDKYDYNSFLEIVKYYLHFPTGKPLSVLARVNNKSPGQNDFDKVRNLVEIGNSFKVASYCLMPNHFHLLIKQVSQPYNTNSIVNFMRRISITYSLYYKDKYNHSGSLFEGKYKNIIVDNDQQLLYLTKYIHLNPAELLNKNQEIKSYIYSSYPRYLGISNTDWLYPDDILNFFSENKPRTSYVNFVEGKPDFPKSMSSVFLDNDS